MLLLTPGTVTLPVWVRAGARRTGVAGASEDDEAEDEADDDADDDAEEEDALGSGLSTSVMLEH